ncbi:type VI secretion protein VasK, partial [Providencia alcalifaciens]
MKKNKIGNPVPISALIIGYLLVITVIVFLAGSFYFLIGNDYFLTQYSNKSIFLYSVISWLALLLLGPIYLYLTHRISLSSITPFLNKYKWLKKSNDKNTPDELSQAMKKIYGTFWHSKVSIQLLLGSHSAVEKLAPSLTQEIWQECDGTLLIYGGDIGSSI